MIIKPGPATAAFIAHAEAMRRNASTTVKAPDIWPRVDVILVVEPQRAREAQDVSQDHSRR